MKRIIAVHDEDLDCVVEAGVTRKELNEHLRDQGLFFPIDPGADASIGGMAATRASGTNAVRYGTMKDNVLALTVGAAGWRVVKTASRARKTSAGYDLTRLLVGSEGTLGIITEITLKLHGIPEAISAGICPFPSRQGGLRRGDHDDPDRHPVARIELLDEVQVRAVNLHSKLGLPESPLLFVEFHGTEAGVQEQAERFGEIAAEFGGGPFEWATEARGPLAPLAGAPRRLLGGQGPAARRAIGGDRCLRADLAARRMRRRDQAGHRGKRPDRADRRPCRRRQFPRPAAGRTRTIRPRSSACEAFIDRLVRAGARHGGHLHRRAWRRPEEDEVSGDSSTGRGALGLMRVLKQAIDPAQHHESRQDRCSFERWNAMSRKLPLLAS